MTMGCPNSHNMIFYLFEGFAADREEYVHDKNEDVADMKLDSSNTEEGTNHEVDVQNKHAD